MLSNAKPLPSAFEPAIDVFGAHLKPWATEVLTLASALRELAVAINTGLTDRDIVKWRRAWLDFDNANNPNQDNKALQLNTMMETLPKLIAMHDKQKGQG